MCFPLLRTKLQYQNRSRIMVRKEERDMQRDEYFGPNTYQIVRTYASRSRPDVTYTTVYFVDSGAFECTCPGFRHRGKCWHVQDLEFRVKKISDEWRSKSRLDRKRDEIERDWLYRDMCVPFDYQASLDEYDRWCEATTCRR